ncbi:MAG: NAD(P)/FAD-dependent oxidoreductase [Anaerolineaceae bacterium]
MPDFDVVVIGGGPAGYSAALRAAELGSRVAMIESEKPGGACVHHACIPTEILLDAALKHVEARELAIFGVFDVGERFNFARAAARKDALVKQMAEGIRSALRMHDVALIEGRAAFVSDKAVSVAGRGGSREVSAEAFVIATGTRWEPPQIPGIGPERILTTDAVQALPSAPGSVLVLAGGPGEVDFGFEYATLLAVAGAEVTLVTPHPRLLPALDATLLGAARAALTDMGVKVIEAVADIRADGDKVAVKGMGGTSIVPAEIVVAADVRRPYFETLNLSAAGVQSNGEIIVDGGCRTNVPNIFAAGDVTRGLMLSGAAIHMGEVAGSNASGEAVTTRLSGLPRVIRGLHEIAWVGRSEDAARAEGFEVVTGVVDLSFNARAVALGARTGIVKVVAERELGQILGVHAVGPVASEVVSVAAGLIQAEATVHDLAAMVAWHPSMTEGLIEAARRARWSAGDAGRS